MNKVTPMKLANDRSFSWTKEQVKTFIAKTHLTDNTESWRRFYNDTFGAPTSFPA